MTDRPHLLSWLRRRLVEALAARRLVWQQPRHAKYKHALLDPTSSAAICGRYASSWKTPGPRVKHCDLCLDLIAQAQGGDTKTTDTPIVLSDNVEGDNDG